MGPGLGVGLLDIGVWVCTGCIWDDTMILGKVGVVEYSFLSFELNSNLVNRTSLVSGLPVRWY